jgi:hypothetical protein
MSRLDSFIARMQAQRVLLNATAAELKSAANELPGPVFELGLGNGRTYDHLREVMPDRRIVAFDRSLVANPRSVPPADDLILGEIAETGPEFARRFGSIGALLHADLGNGVSADDTRLQQWLPATVLAMLRSGGLVLTSTQLTHPHLRERRLPQDVPPGRYFMYRRA